MSSAMVVEDGQPCLRLLGGFKLLVGSQPVDLPSNAQRVLGYLALSRSELRREELAGRIWQCSNEQRAAASLRTALWRIRRAHPRLVTSTHDVVRLHEDLTVDVAESTRLARRLLDSDQDSDVDLFCWPERLLEADLLPHWDEDWVLLERERLRQLRLHALESLSRRFTARRHYAAAIDTAYAAITAETLRESAWAALIEAHLSEGNSAEADRQLTAYQAILRTELGLEPSPGLVALVRGPAHR